MTRDEPRDEMKCAEAGLNKRKCGTTERTIERKKENESEQTEKCDTWGENEMK